MLLVLTSTNQVQIYEPTDSYNSVSWHISLSLTDIFLKQLNNPISLTPELLDQIEIMSVAWSFALCLNPHLSMIAMGSKIGEITLWR